MSLKKAYAPYFKIGAAVPASAFEEKAALTNLWEHYSSITCENDMKPEEILDEERNCSDPEQYQFCPAVRFDRIRKYLEFSREHQIGMRGHTLVWHQQTPRWFFTKDYSREPDAPYADRNVMLLRMENYIRMVLEFVQKEYPGVVYAWDVVNEAIDDGELRRSVWTETVGDDFVIQAFRFARKYADPGVSLIYNDYDTFLPWKREMICDRILRPLMAEKLVDGVGMQSHLTMAVPELREYEKSIQAFGALGLEIHVTEMDLHNADPSEASMQELAERYRQIFSILIKCQKTGEANLTSVTFWGLRDEDSWLHLFRKEKSYPLLFDGAYEPKAAYYAVLAEAQKQNLTVWKDGR